MLFDCRFEDHLHIVVRGRFVGLGSLPMWRKEKLGESTLLLTWRVGFKKEKTELSS